MSKAFKFFTVCIPRRGHAFTDGVCADCGALAGGKTAADIVAEVRDGQEKATPKPG